MEKLKCQTLWEVRCWIWGRVVKRMEAMAITANNGEIMALMDYSGMSCGTCFSTCHTIVEIFIITSEKFHFLFSVPDLFLDNEVILTSEYFLWSFYSRLCPLFVWFHAIIALGDKIKLFYLYVYFSSILFQKKHYIIV